ncbi:hypothetical protein [Phormidium sp. FACHB-1136]|uniref:hypothetical protein n=1 Tax=Phormidium sp. FACHB-1136 TaxID=2692848 RepID=UPI0032201F92
MPMLSPSLTLIFSLAMVAPALALPQPEDTPEEILRTEIITEARSPLTGEPLSATEYAILMEQLQDPNRNPQVSPEVAQLIGLLQFRRVVKPILPFIR